MTTLPPEDGWPEGERPDGEAELGLGGAPLDDFSEADFDAAFEAAFGSAVEPERTIKPDGEARAGAPLTPAGASAEAAEPGRTSAEDPLEASAAPHPGEQSVPAKRSAVAVVLTPVASAPALAAICAMANLDAHIIPTKHGALAARVIAQGTEPDPEELLTGAPAEATALARALSRTARDGVVLLVSHLGEGDEGLTGSITGRRFVNQEPADEVAAGLILASADDVVEQLLLGSLTPEEAPGRLAPQELSKWQASRLFTKSLRRKRP